MNQYNIIPVSKPRQTRSDTWKKRPCVMRYRAFADKVRAAGIKIPEAGAHICFVLPMPKSWSKQRKQIMDGQPHQQTPDVDNLQKALMDSVYKNDSHIWDIRVTKIWGQKGKIKIKPA